VRFSTGNFFTKFSSMINCYSAEVQYLLGQGAKTYARDTKYGWTPIFAAISKNRHDIVKLLIEAGASVSKLKEGNQGKNNPRIFHRVLIYFFVDDPDREGRTPLWIATMMGYTAIVSDLLSRGADKNKADNKGIQLFWEIYVILQGRTPAYIAVQMSRKECLGILIEAGANLELHDDDKRTPLVLAYKLGKIFHKDIFLHFPGR
jgi:ankyrin repeat protein